jgi:NAD(P)-dependent dehydrogenase (short-subunit alcohol dehydrogenase family)
MRYRTAIVTGASRGLGLEVSRQLAGRGLQVVAASRTPPEDVAGVEWIETDVGSPESVRALFAAARERFGPVDVLVNNAGVGAQRLVEELTDEEILETIAVNLTGLVLCSRAALPDMLEAGRGLILNVGSDLSRRFNTGMAVYTATKFGVLGFSGSLLREVKDRGVKVCAILPGVIDTGFGGFAPEGSRGASEGLPARELAEQIVAFLDHPEHLVVDELVVHPVGQQGF